MIWQYVQLHWVEWLFTIITAILGFLYRDIRKRMKKEQQKNNAIADGVQSLLRESIVQNYNKYQDNNDIENAKKILSDLIQDTKDSIED